MSPHSLPPNHSHKLHLAAEHQSTDFLPDNQPSSDDCPVIREDPLTTLPEPLKVVRRYFKQGACLTTRSPKIRPKDREHIIFNQMREQVHRHCHRREVSLNMRDTQMDGGLSVVQTMWSCFVVEQITYFLPQNLKQQREVKPLSH